MSAKLLIVEWLELRQRRAVVLEFYNLALREQSEQLAREFRVAAGYRLRAFVAGHSLALRVLLVEFFEREAQRVGELLELVAGDERRVSAARYAYLALRLARGYRAHQLRHGYLVHARRLRGSDDFAVVDEREDALFERRL